MEQPAKVREAVKRYPDESKVREIYRQMDDTEKAEAHRWIEADYPKLKHYGLTLERWFVEAIKHAAHPR